MPSIHSPAGSFFRRCSVICACLVAAFPAAALAGWTDWWLTADQQGQRAAEQGRYLEAAALYEDPGQKAAAFYRGGDFESAATVFGRMRGAEAAFNRGNALVMLGRYDEAIRSYQDALAADPDWVEARDNLALARARREKLAPPDDDAGGTGGQLGADEIVFDDSGRVDNAGAEVETEGGEALSEDEMRKVWLRRIQNDPADFLRARFAYQLYRREEEREGEKTP